MTEVRIRTLSEEDFELYREIRLRMLERAPDAYGTTFEQQSTEPVEAWRARYCERLATTSAFLLADSDAGPLGTAATFEEGPGVVHVAAMWVEEEARGQRVAERLLEAAEAWARERGAGRLLLEVTAGNAPAERLYERTGFRPTGRRDALRPGSHLETIELSRPIVEIA